MATISRTSILRGPCQIIFNEGTPIYSKGDVTVTARTQTLAISTSGFGEVDQRAQDIEYRIKFTPSGQLLTHYAQLYAPMALTVGRSIFGSTDQTLVIKPFTSPQAVLTFKNVGISQMPPLRLSAGETVFGEVEFTAMRTDASTWEVVDSIVAASVHSAPSHTSFTAATHSVQPYTSAWGLDPWDNFETEAGWTITPAMDLFDQRVDNAGLVDRCVRTLSVTAEAVPVDTGLTEAVVLARLRHAGSGIIRGQSLAAGGADLYITGLVNELAVQVDQAALVDVQLGWGGESKRVGKCTWRATRTFTAGVANPLLTFTEAV